MGVTVSRQLKKLGKDSLFYGLGSAVQKFISFFLFPIYTRVLSQEDFGAQDLISTTVMIIVYFLVLGLDSGTARHYYDAETSENKETVLSTWLWFELLVSIPVCISLIIFARPICVRFFNDNTLAPFLQLALASIPFRLLVSVTTLTLRLTFQSRKFGVISVVGVLIQAIAAIGLVVFFRMGLMGVFWASMISSICHAFLGLVFTYEHFRVTLSQSWLKRMLAFGLPLVPASLSLWILNHSNRYFLVSLAGLSEVGLYGVGVRVSSILTFVISAFQTAWGPFAYSLIRDKLLARQTYAKVLTYYLLGSLLATVSVTVFAREFVLVLTTPDYESAAIIVPWLCYGAIAWGAVYIVGMGYVIEKKSYHTTIATITAGLVNFLLNVFLIPIWGIMGAAISVMLGNLAAFIYSYHAGQHYFLVKYEFGKLFKLVIATTLVIVASMFIDRIWPSWEIKVFLYKIPLYIAFVASLFLLRIISRAEVKAVRDYAMRRLASLNPRHVIQLVWNNLSSSE